MDKEYLIRKWLADELTETELEAFKKLDDYPLYTAIIENAPYFQASHFSPVDDFEQFKANVSLKDKSVRKINRIKPLLRIAAVLIVAFGVYFGFFFNTMVKIQTSAGQKITAVLPDASTATLNAMSEIRYSKKRWESNRQVKLKGEAFFDVSKGATFDVLTPEGKVSVLGTKFNVKQRIDYFEVQCYEGAVSVSSQNNTAKLIAGETYRISGGKPISEKGETLLKQPQWWVKNISSFERVSLDEVIAELERQYNIEVISNDIIKDRLFTGSFVHNDLKNALKSITEPLGINYRVENPNQVRLYDTD